MYHTSVWYAKKKLLGGGEGSVNGAVEVGDVEGFFEETAGAGVAGFGFGGAAAGDDDDFGRGIFFGEEGGTGQAVHARHADVHHNDIGVRGLVFGDGVVPVDGEADDFVAEVFNGEAQGVTDRVSIICNEDFHRR